MEPSSSQSTRVALHSSWSRCSAIQLATSLKMLTPKVDDTELASRLAQKKTAMRVTNDLVLKVNLDFIQHPHKKIQAKKIALTQLLHQRQQNQQHLLQQQLQAVPHQLKCLLRLSLLLFHSSSSRQFWSPEIFKKFNLYLYIFFHFSSSGKWPPVFILLNCFCYVWSAKRQTILIWLIVAKLWK